MNKRNYLVLSYSFDSGLPPPKGAGIFYHCKKCDGFVQSAPQNSEECQCGNVFIDLERFSADAFDRSQVEVVKINDPALQR